METKPLYYDGSGHFGQETSGVNVKKAPIVLTDQMRKQISGNPYPFIDITKK